MNEAINVQGSIRRRLLLTLLGGALVLAVGLFFVFQRLAIQLAEESQDNVLRAAATAILDSAAAFRDELDLDLPYSAFSMLSNAANDRVFYAIQANGAFLTGYDDLPFPASPEPGNPHFLTTEYQQQTIRLVSMTRVLSVGDDPLRLTIAIAQTQDGQTELMGRVVRIAALVGAGVFFLVLNLAIISTKTTISPLVRLAVSVEKRGPNELRPVAAPVPVEMAPLVTSLNSFMERLKISLSRTEEFIADAAHRLRTPLAIVRTRAEATLLRVEKEENRAALKDMIRAIDESSRAAGQMLDHAMVTLRADSLEKRDVNLTSVVHELVERMSPAAELREVEIKEKLTKDLSVSGDPILIQSALRNILENALKFSPAGGEITLEVKPEENNAVVTIQDQGIGFPDDNLEKLTERFKRGVNAYGTIGSGLGLTIASDVAKAHNGTIYIRNNSGAGACVTLYLPFS